MEKIYQKEFFKAQSLYFEACNREQIAWQDWNTLSEKTDTYESDSGEIITPKVTEELSKKMKEASEKLNKCKQERAEAKKEYQKAGAVV